jgi:hypothetical protein
MTDGKVSGQDQQLHDQSISATLPMVQTLVHVHTQGSTVQLRLGCQPPSCQLLIVLECELVCSAANGLAQKLYNWSTLNTRVFKRLGFVIAQRECEVQLSSPAEQGFHGQGVVDVLSCIGSGTL